VAVDDLWYLRKRDPATGERLRSQRHGRGKRWRVRWLDPESGQTRTEFFARRADADRHDANMHADISRGQYVDPRAGRLTVEDYAEQWRKSLLHRGSTAERTERVIRRHINPVIGALPLSQVRSSHIRGWVKDRTPHLAPSTLSVVFFGTLVPLFNAAVVDRRIGTSPCVGIRLPEIPDAATTSRGRTRCTRSHRPCPSGTGPSSTSRPDVAGEAERSSVWSTRASTSMPRRCTSASSSP
jgi:hypothetical protein